ncbi:MAG: L,D-transpeptidase family protein [Archangium sp.]
MRELIPFVLLALSSCAHPRPTAQQARQVLVVTTDDWNSVDASAVLYEGGGGHWNARWKSSAVVGKNGLAWGSSTETASLQPSGLSKREGDGRAPAGAFKLAYAFGTERVSSRWKYRELLATTECVDDSKSAQYNRLVESDEVTRDWSSSEVMRNQPLYALGAFVEHNAEPIEPGAGSCIFLHVWREAGRGTAGCTAMPREALAELLYLLRTDAMPLLVQLPRAEYERVRAQMSWP